MNRIILYSTESCPYCLRAKDYLRSKGVKFEEIDVSRDKKELDKMIKKTGQIGVPVIDMGGKIIVGFDQKEIDGQLKAEDKS